MRLLLDTHIFLWCVKKDRRLLKPAMSLISRATDVYISSASIWELTIKIGLKKIEADIDELVEAIYQSGFAELPITARHAAAVMQLANHHRDPFDRILIAQSITEPLTFLTADQGLKGYSNLIEVVES